MKNSAAWLFDDAGSTEPRDAIWRADGTRSIFRDLSEISRGLQASFESTVELIESAILRHTGATAAGSALFAGGGYVAARDCPVIAGFPGLGHLMQQALEQRQPLAANAISAPMPPCNVLISPIVAGDTSIGVIWAVGRFANSPTAKRHLEMLDWLADMIAMSRERSDLTERRRIETELRSARQVADQANQAKSRFLATASHDLRQPLQSLSLLSGTLRRMATNPYLLEAVEQQELAIATMSGLLNALLDISKLESGLVQPERQNIDLGAILEQMRTEFAGLAAKKGLDLKIPACSLFVHTDPTLFGQILRNLVSNALRYTQAGSVSLSVIPRDAGVDIEVSDTGIGVAESHLDKIFEEFYQIEAAPNSAREGHGLGLSIVRRAAAILGHGLSVISALGAGSCFKISVPLGEASVEVRRQDAATLLPAAGKAPHILLIDDDPGVLKATRLLLEVEGYRVTVGRTVADARAAAAKYRDIRLLISDYHLSDGESGSTVIAMLREAMPRIEVILMTGDTSSGLRHVSPADGICVASKPIEADALLGMMNRLLLHQAAAPCRQPP